MSSIPGLRARRSAALVLAAALAAAASASSQEPPAPGKGGVSVAQDLLAVITLRGKPCGAVASYERLGETDYAVRCEDGHRYRVRVNDRDRVVVEER